MGGDALMTNDEKTAVAEVELLNELAQKYGFVVVRKTEFDAMKKVWDRHVEEMSWWRDDGVYVGPDPR